MFTFRGIARAKRPRFRFVRGLYKRFRAENTREARGLRLMREWLSPNQRAQFDARGYFEVTGCDSGRRYRVYRGTMSNVYELDELGRPKMGWCFVPLGNLVAGDVMLAQKLALETSEYVALAAANRLLPSQAFYGRR